MFTNNTYISLQPSYINRPVPLFTYSASNKENQNSFSLQKAQNHPHSDHELHPHNNKPRFAQPLADMGLYEHAQTSRDSNDTPTGLNMIKQRSSGSREGVSRCRHGDVRSYKRAYCKDCGAFLPKSGAQTYKEQCFKEKLNVNPDEVYKIMLDNQGKNRDYVQGSSHLKRRKILVDWINEIGEGLKFYPDTICITISYIDTILTKVQIPKNKLQLIALCCLILAGKFSEKEDKVPSYKELMDFCNGAYSVNNFKRTERFVLEMLDWNLKTITPFQFVQFYLSKGCVFSTDRSVIRGIDSKLLRYLRKYSEFFADMSIQNYDFNSYQSHILACSAICGARKAVGLHPIWNPELEELTEVAWIDIEPCFTMLYGSFEATFPEIANKANSYSDQIHKKPEVRDLEQRYAAMSIENTMRTPFKPQNLREERNSDYSSSQKENSPSPYEGQCGSKIPEWASSIRRKMDRIEEKPMRNVGIKLFKKVDEDEMNIENICEELIRRDTMNNNVKRNLVF